MAKPESAGPGAHAELMQQRALMFGLTHEPVFRDADEFYVAALQATPNSSVTGAAIFGFDRDTGQLAALVTADGLEANQPHLQHIHGFASGQDAIHPTLAAADADNDGYIEGAEGGPFWGPVQLDFPTQTPADDDFFIVETFQLPQQALGADPMLALKVYNIHGMSVPDGAGAGTPNEVNGAGGYKLGLVVAGGEIEPVTSGRELHDFIAEHDVRAAVVDQIHEQVSSLFSSWIA